MKTKSMTWLGVLLVLGLLVTDAVAATGGAVPLVVRLQPNADGSTTVRFQGTTGAGYRIESSDNLEAWTVVSVSVTAAGDWTEWRDIRPAAQAQRFYRVTGVASGAALTVMRAVDPDSASERLLTALAAGDNATVIAILRGNGVGENTLETLAKNLGQKPQRRLLDETFFRVSVSVPLTGMSNAAPARLAAADALGYGRRFWVAKKFTNNWAAHYDRQRALMTTAPVGALDFTLGDTNLIAWFKWYDRYAEGLHSVAVNWTHLSNHVLQDGYTNVNRTLSGLHKLIKARKPDAFVWVGVVKKDTKSDVPWLQAMTFKPDGLLVWNLAQFHSPFAETRKRFVPVVGADTPMVVAGFYGYKPALLDSGKKLQAAKLIADATARTEAQSEADAKMADIGKITRNFLGREEAELQRLGYRGIAAHGLLLEALTQANKADR